MWYLVMVVVLLGALLAHAQYRLVTVQTDITMHVPPDLSRGARLKPNRPEPSSVYLYTQHIWQQINEWLSSGTTDYRAAIDQYQCYVSPEFFGWLNRHYVRDAGNGTWYVWLDMTITERVAGEVVKDDVIRYPLYAYLDSRSCNQFGVAIGGFFADQERL